MRYPIFLVSIATMTLAGCASHNKKQPAAQSSIPSADQARMYKGFGNYTRTVTTDSAQAQKYFNQGMQLLYGFNHDEAIRSFEKAAELKPDSSVVLENLINAYKAAGEHDRANEATARLESLRAKQH